MSYILHLLARCMCVVCVACVYVHACMHHTMASLQKSQMAYVDVHQHCYKLGDGNNNKVPIYSGTAKYCWFCTVAIMITGRNGNWGRAHAKVAIHWYKTAWSRWCKERQLPDCEPVHEQHVLCTFTLFTVSPRSQHKEPLIQLAHVVTCSGIQCTGVPQSYKWTYTAISN